MVAVGLAVALSDPRQCVHVCPLLSAAGLALGWRMVLDVVVDNTIFPSCLDLCHQTLRATPQEGEKLDKDALMREALSGQMKERQDLEKKLGQQACSSTLVLISSPRL